MRLIIYLRIWFIFLSLMQLQRWQSPVLDHKIHPPANKLFLTGRGKHAIYFFFTLQRFLKKEMP